VTRHALLILWVALLSVQWQARAAEQLYKYRDANGQWVYTDRKPDSSNASVETVTVTPEGKAPRIEVQAVNAAAAWQLLAVNDCQCVVEFVGAVAEPHNLKIASGTAFHAVLTPRSQQTVLQFAHNADEGDVGARLAWRAVLGEPGAQHRPPMPYRAPFALGSAYKITQAYPSRFTHVTPADQYAVDIALPDGTAVDAAREGLVINVRHDKYMNAADPVMLDQANMVEILHDDGTIAVYAHLHWDSVRVQPGQYVKRGEYIADSGNTGFTTGPHLHFAVIRNAGMSDVAVPVEFLSAAGKPVTPQTNMMLMAY
jgi:murein DD-endopeptidase MepM/ murein hydrolase activator NlpD